jgi:hypothetical protein
MLLQITPVERAALQLLVEPRGGRHDPEEPGDVRRPSRSSRRASAGAVSSS